LELEATTLEDEALELAGVVEMLAWLLTAGESTHPERRNAKNIDGRRNAFFMFFAP
jgi:hypothetical protein